MIRQITLVAIMCLMPITAQAQSLKTDKVSSGACMVICDDVRFCINIDYNRQTGTCTIFFNPADPDYVRLQKTCPQEPPQKWTISYANEKWAIKCPDNASNGAVRQTAPLPPNLFEGLEDPQ